MDGHVIVWMGVEVLTDGLAHLHPHTDTQAHTNDTDQTKTRSESELRMPMDSRRWEKG